MAHAQTSCISLVAARTHDSIGLLGRRTGASARLLQAPRPPSSSARLQPRWGCPRAPARCTEQRAMFASRAALLTEDGHHSMAAAVQGLVACLVPAMPFVPLTSKHDDAPPCHGDIQQVRQSSRPRCLASCSCCRLRTVAGLLFRAPLGWVTLLAIVVCFP